MTQIDRLRTVTPVWIINNVQSLYSCFDKVFKFCLLFFLSSDFTLKKLYYIITFSSYYTVMCNRHRLYSLLLSAKYPLNWDCFGQLNTCLCQLKLHALHWLRLNNKLYFDFYYHLLSLHMLAPYISNKTKLTHFCIKHCNDSSKECKNMTPFFATRGDLRDAGNWPWNNDTSLSYRIT